MRGRSGTFPHHPIEPVALVVSQLSPIVDKNREERSLKDREREVRRESDRRHLEVRAGRGAYQKEEGTRVFQAMLVDFARTHEMTFEQVERKMKNDSRWDQCSLGNADMEDLFTQHTAVLYDKVRRAFFAALDTFTQGNLEVTWADILRDHPEIKDDPRFLRLSTHPDTRTTETPSLFAQYSREKVACFSFSSFLLFFFLLSFLSPTVFFFSACPFLQLSQARQEFQELLRESKFISYQVSAETRGQPVKMKEILASLEVDRRHQRLAFMEAERSKMLERYIEELQGKLKIEVDRRSKIEEGVLKDH